MKDGLSYSAVSYLKSDRATNPSYLKSNHQEAGYILLVYSCIITFALILFAAGYLKLQENQIFQMEREIRSTKAFYIAQAGLQKIFKDKKITGGSFAGGQYTKIATPTPSSCIAVRGEFEGVTRTLEATREQSDFKGALYCHDTPSLYNLPGTIRGGTHYAIQSAEYINTMLLERVPITFECNLPQNECILDRSPREDYIPIEQRLKDEERIFAYIESNSNNQIVEHQYSISNTLYTIPPGGSQYRYRIDEAGRIKVAELIVNGRLELPPGRKTPAPPYYLTRLILSENAILTGRDGPVKIFCISNTTSDVTLNRRSHIIGYNGEASNFTLEVYSRNKAQIAINESCEFIGTILAPGCTLIFDAGIYIRGGIVVEGFQPTDRSTAVGPAPWLVEFDENLLAGSPLINWRERREPG